MKDITCDYELLENIKKVMNTCESFGRKHAENTPTLLVFPLMFL